ncbi:MAG: ABC-ATPase domain-containing protein [Proteobacteria bacterium]|nr:ABC-ATPase domain-containing protein [Pseudomonadota bacterium]
MEGLRSIIKSIDGKGYKAYKQIQGDFDFGDYSLIVDHVQGDPFALASRISIYVKASRAAIPSSLWATKVRKIALEDYLGRVVSRSISANVKGRRGTGKGGEIAIETSGQQVLPRNALILSSERVEARLTVGLPADGRKILGKDAEEMFFKELPQLVKESLFFENLDSAQAEAHVQSVEDQDYLRSWLKEKGLIAFVANGSMLPRFSGVDDRPLTGGVIPFKSPENFAFTPTLPNRGQIRGMGIGGGVTLIVGGGFHGKSTLLHALERGIYNHIPGDGRELVVTEPTAVKIRSEDSRSVSDVNISPFIDRLPFNRDTVRFSTENASGSTSQAANIIEALECDARLLLIDEDTSATNFMIRDERMQALVVRDKEPITPFLHRVRELYTEMGVSTVIVMGGSGDYFDVSDRVIMMDAYEPKDVTEMANRLARPEKMEEGTRVLPPMDKREKRRPDVKRLSPRRGRYEEKIDIKDVDQLVYGVHKIDLSKVEQLVDMGQTRTIGLLISYYAKHYVSKTESLTEGLALAFKEIEKSGLDILSTYKVGNLALPRLHEVAAAINRIRP